VPDIRYVCLSDLHLGAATSVLTHLDAEGNHSPRDPAPLLTAVLAGLRKLIRDSGTTTPPTLVLHGDLFELALTTMEVAADTFGHLVTEAWGDPDDPLFAYEVLFVPGNHDHHLWEITREQQYEDYLHQSPNWNRPMVHVTAMRPDRLADTDREPIVGEFARRALGVDSSIASPIFRVLYPNLGLVDESGERGVVITHGHYLEPMYRAMTYLHNAISPKRPPRLTIAQLEADNWAWIDFFWSTMGRSGEGDADEVIPVLYELLQDQPAMQAIVNRVIDEFLPRNRSLLRRAQRWTLRRAGRHASAEIASRERHHAELLSPAATTGLTHYVEGPVLGQLLDEFDEVPKRLDFVFGHTHKPFAARRQPGEYPGVVVAHNSGGWVVDAVHPEPNKGASVVLISSELEVVDLSIYHQEVDPDDFRVAVTAVIDPRDEPTPLRAWLLDRIDADATPWAEIADLAALTVRERRQQLERRIQRGTAAVRSEPPVGPRGW